MVIFSAIIHLFLYPRIANIWKKRMCFATYDFIALVYLTQN